MKKETLFDILDKSKSKSDAARNLGYTYYNGKINEILHDIADSVNFDLTIYNERKKRFCLVCSKQLNKEQQKFCSSSCAASYNNKGRIRTKESRDKVAKIMKEKYENGELEYFKQSRFTSNNQPRKKEKWINICIICKKEFSGMGIRTQRKTCSENCMKIARTCRTYKNGSRKTIYYDNK